MCRGSLKNVTYQSVLASPAVSSMSCLTEAKEATIVWEFAFQTNQKIKCNRPDIVDKDYQRKTCLLPDLSVPTDNNISVKEYNKIS